MSEISNYGKSFLTNIYNFSHLRLFYAKKEMQSWTSLYFREFWWIFLISKLYRCFSSGNIYVLLIYNITNRLLVSEGKTRFSKKIKISKGLI